MWVGIIAFTGAAPTPFFPRLKNRRGPHLESAPHVRNRSCAPVFIVGSPRSGTTLLYDTLLSAGGFALYLGESNIFNLLAPRFGDLSIRKNREKMFEVWLGSSLFRVSGLKPSQVEGKILDECRNAGDFLRTVMDEMARQQGAPRWAGNAPEEILHLHQIKQTIPNALVIHMIRDGRDVSLSLSQKRYIRPFPWKERETPEGAALYWEWMVGKGRAASAWLGKDYIEIRFEDLVSDPRSVLRTLSAFLEQELDYEHVLKNPVGAVAKPNTSFRGKGEFNPVARWKQQFTPEQLKRVEGLIGSTLKDLGYELATTGPSEFSGVERGWDRFVYRQFFELKLHWKTNALAHALRSPLTAREIDDIVLVDEVGARRMHTATGATDPPDVPNGSSQERMAQQPLGKHL